MSLTSILIFIGGVVVVTGAIALARKAINRLFDQIEKREAQGFSDPAKDPSDPAYHQMEPAKEEAKEADKDDMRPRGDW